MTPESTSTSRASRSPRSSASALSAPPDELLSLHSVLAHTDASVRRGESAGAHVVATGFDPLDSYLSGGLRTGELVLLGGPQGLGKTTLVLQMARNVAVAGGRVIYLSFEHDEITVLAKLIALEAGLAHGVEAMSLRRIRDALDATTAYEEGLEGRLRGHTGGVEALTAVSSYSDRFLVHRSTGTATGVEQIRDLVEEARKQSGEPPVVIVDYLQKVAMRESGLDEDERVTVIVEGLKDLALECDVAVLAVVAADKSGLREGGRLRSFDLRGSSALAYEADVILMLQDKYDIVARHHLIYDVGNAERFKSYAVITIEKNRGGLDAIDLEFHKQFEQSRFDTVGQPVREQLLDNRVFVE